MNVRLCILTLSLVFTLATGIQASYPLPCPVDPAISAFAPANDPETFMPQIPKLGFDGTMLYGYGLRVDTPEFGNLADQLGLRPGDVITRINGVAVQSPDHYRALLIAAAEMNQGQVELEVQGPTLTAGSRLVVCNVRGTFARIDAGPAF